MNDDSRQILLAAREKLSKMYNDAKDQQFAKPIINYLWGRCKEELGFAEDVLQDHKTYDRMKTFINTEARKFLKGVSGAVVDTLVYEWAEDYFRKDDKAEIEKQEAEAKKHAEETKARIEEAKKQKASKPAESVKKPQNVQMSLLDFISQERQDEQEGVEADTVTNAVG